MKTDYQTLLVAADERILNVTLNRPDKANALSPTLLDELKAVLDDAEAVPLGNEPIYCGDRIFGQTTSAAFGYRVGKPVALGYVEAPVTDGQPAEIDIARNLFAGRISTSPAWDPSGARMKA